MNKDSVGGQLIRIIFVILAGMLLAWLVTLIILLVHFSFDVTAALTQTTILFESTGMLRLLQGVQSLSIFVFPPFLFYWMNGERPALALQIHKPQPEKVLLAVISLIAAIPLINVLVAWNEGIQLPASLQGMEEWMRQSEQKASELTLKMVSGTAWYDLVFSLLIVAVLAGFGEELLFRGLLQGTLVKLMGKKYTTKNKPAPRWVTHVSIWMAAFLFSAIHLQFYGFIPRLLLGAWFGYLLWWSGSIWVPIVAHMANNALSVVFLFAENKKWMTESPDNLGTADTWWMSLLSLPVFAACIILLKRKKKQAGG